MCICVYYNIELVFNRIDYKIFFISLKIKEIEFSGKKLVELIR